MAPTHTDPKSPINYPENQELFQIFLEHTPVAIAMLDCQMRYMLTSRRWLIESSLGDQNISGRSHYEVFPERLDHWQEIHRRCLSGAVEIVEEDTFQRADGTTDWVRWEIRPWRNCAGEIGGLIMFIEVITQWKQAELALKQAEAALAKANEELEIKVKKRTTKLKQAIKTLKTEIVERKQAQAAVKNTEKMYQQILDAITDMVLVKGSESRIVWANKACRDYYNMTNEELCNLIDVPLNQQDYIQQYIKDDAHVFNTGETLIIPEEPITRHDGEVKLFNTIKSAIFNSEGQVILTVGASRDISDRLTALRDRQQAQEELQESYNLLRSVIESTPDTVFVKDLEGRLVMLNSSCVRLLGKPMEEVLGKNDAELWPPEMARLVRQKDLKIMTTGVAETFEEKVPENGVMRTYLTTKSPWRDPQGNIIGLIGISRDISDRKQAEEALQQKTQQLELTLYELQTTQAQLVQTEKMSSLGQLVAGIAHEINNPVNFIYGNIIHVSQYTEDLLRLVRLYQRHYPKPIPEIEAEVEEIDLDFLVEDLPKMLNSMTMGAERIREIVLSLRNFSRLDEAEMKPVDIHEGIENTLLILQSRLKAKASHCAIEVIKDYGNLPLVECYAGQMNQVFMNLLTNAIDALDEYNSARSPEQIQLNPSTITIRTSVVQGSSFIVNDIEDRTMNPLVKIQIADNGPGMAPEIQNRLFDPFFTTKPVGKGTGLGLAISYQIVVEKHGGQLQCISEPGKGATFTIEIPVQQDVMNS